MFSHMACICHFVFYALPRASYGYIQCGFIPSAVWRFSNIFSELFRCRNLAFNRFFSYILVADMFLYLGGVSGCPAHIHVHPCMFVCPHTFVCLPGVYMPPICPHTLLCLCVILETLHVVGSCNGLPFV